MELIEMLMKGFGQSQSQSQQQSRQDYQYQQDQLRQQQEYQDLQRQMQNQQQYQQPAQDQVFNGDLGELGRQLGVSPDKMQQIIKMAMPLILGQLGQNVQSDDGAHSLSEALNKHAGRQYSSPQDIDEEDGKGILGHIFGSGQPRATEGLGRATGIQAGQAGQLLRMLAPVVMAFLASRAQASNLNPGGLGSVLGRERESAQQNGPLGGLLGAVLDRNGDGQVGLDDIVRIGGSLFGGRR